MPAYEVVIKKSSVIFADDAEEAQQIALEEMTDAWNEGYDLLEIFEVEVTECGDEPGTDPARKLYK
jgi:uncharacterized protein (UPF0212 family)